MTEQFNILFPELVDKMFWITTFSDVCSDDGWIFVRSPKDYSRDWNIVDATNNFNNISTKDGYFEQKDIEKHCLSRQRVREAIEEIGGTQDLMEAREQLLKELGLGDE